MSNKHTVSLKLAKRMKKLGWKKETLSRWTGQKYQVDSKTEPFTLVYYPKKGTIKNYLFYPAPIASEILEELPEEIDNLDAYTYQLTLTVFQKIYYAKYVMTGYKPVGSLVSKQASTPAEALGEMWCYLIKHKKYEK